ncbi:UTP--glucose-1-phosphate uridylyltransferase [Corchorus olitorius]|uniref:UTP--glucose-1-phosphate uridylyltransferase n=1 Tax=Corchorus olitorius TaxID=93759 RepID=A0A1R3IJS9_9ROSI|nr:UTP--glucose-1-phosphate uridylyltransferase [Corchorus olitorius]
MQKASSLLCSNPISSAPTSLYTRTPLTVPLKNRLSSSLSASSRLRLSLNCLHGHRHGGISPLQSTATEEMIEVSNNVSGFVEIGYLSSVHGLQGEICVKPTLIFLNCGFARWLRQQVSGKETIKEVELVEGREHPGQKSWILSFSGIETVDQARQLVGSTLLAEEDDRPHLEEGEFYTRDLVGMRVILKETGQVVGRVVNVFNSGANNDLLHVMLKSSMPNGSGESNLTEAGDSGPLVWVPFVEEIVPNVDLTRREMLITPPKGLLELNVRSDERSKKERRQLEWKERKKFQKRLIAAKKKLCEMKQQHIFLGFRFGEKSQTSLLADQILSVNSKLLQQALQNIEIASKRWTITESLTGTKLVRNRLKISERCLGPCTHEEKLGENLKLREKALNLVSKGKLAVVLDVSDHRNEEKEYDDGLALSLSMENSETSSLQTLLGDDERFVKVEYRSSVPLVLICPADEMNSVEKLFSSNNHFGFDPEKVWFLEEERLPVVSSELEQNRHKILMKSPWEILQSPVGSGGVISLLSSNNIAESFAQMGVEYIQVCQSERYIDGSSLLLGFVNSSKADVGIQIFEETKDVEEGFGMIFSMDLMKKLTRQINKLQFYATTKPNSHVELVEKEWVNVDPSFPNSYEIFSTIYSCLNACSLDKICVMEITE